MNMRHALLLLVLLTFGVVSTADAQYFGRNKVQYEDFEFQVLSTEHFDIYYYPEEAEAVQLAARMAERWYARLSQLLRHELNGRQPLILYAAHPHFRQTTALSGEVGEGTGGVTEMFKRRIVLPFAGGLAETDHVLGHELVHAFQFDMSAARDAEGNRVGPAVLSLPLWFIEGMAEYLSVGPVDANTAMWVREAIARDAMPAVKDLNDPDFFPYRYGHAFWAYVAGRWGDQAVGDLLRATGPRGDIESAIEAVLGVDEETLTRDWHEATRRTYAPFFETTRRASTYGRPVMNRETSGGTINLAPSISPDGRRLVFLSERSRLSIDMYVAEVATGRVQRRLVETAADPHFDSLQFLNSAGDWAPDNRRFAFAAVSKGQPVLTIVDADTARREMEHVFPELGEIFDPAWSPDGRHIAFSALHGGVLDLFVFDLETRTLTPLTDDAFADLHPEWSPDGTRLAFATDRFSSNLSTLVFGNTRLGVLDVASRQVQPLAGFPAGRNTNPEFTDNGQALLFIAAPDGIANVYRTDLASGATTQVTNLLSGVSGITPLTPALTAAANAPVALFSVFENNEYNIYAAETPEQLAGRQAEDAGRPGDLLAPIERKESAVASLLEAPTVGLPAPTDYPEKDYSPRLTLDAIGQPSVGVGADRFGAYAAGGLSFLFSDMLGEHQLFTTVQLTSRFEEIGGSVGYINRTNRWNWGVIGEQTPYVTGAFAQGITTVNGQTVIAQETLRVTQINRAVSGILQYPFSRAHRFETAAGIRRISFDRQIDTQFFSPFTGQFLDETRQELPRPEAINLGEASAALVYDTSVFGATSPIVGQRYRMELSQTAGSLQYTGALLDYRKYFMPASPYTFALRGLHYGRYGQDGEDPRLSPLFLGYPGLVRGYEVNSFAATECAIDAVNCAAFDQLVGSRMALASAEFRVPLIGLFNPRAMYGGVPVEIGVFADAGVAWTSASEPTFLGGNRDWVRSVGAVIRFNAFGYAIGEIDYVKPLDRPERGWVWQFNLTPGF